MPAILLCFMLSSCSHEDINLLPDGEYPLKLAATVDDMMSRADAPGYWVTGDKIRVRIGTYPRVGIYSLNTDGSVKEAIDALAWPHPQDSVSAWYPCLEENAIVSIGDQSNGYHAFDFMAASTHEIVNYTDIVNLNFKHQMAKVRCELFKGDGITDEDLETAKVSYYGFNNVTFSEKGLTSADEDWIIPYSNCEALLYPGNMSGKNFIKVDLTVNIKGVDIPKTLTYIPDEGKGNIEAGRYYTYKITVQKDRLEVQTITGAWTESLENTEPTSDKYHIYLTENTGELGELEFSSNVTEISADTRAGSGRYLEVLGDYFTISYKPDATNCHLGIVFANKETLNEVKRIYYETNQNSENTDDNTSAGYYEFSYKIVSPIGETVYLKKGEHVEVGDYLFNDGKWGGIPDKIYSQGEKTPVGIVFKVGAGGDSQHNTLDVPANYGWNDNREIRGYAVALNDASEGRLKWGPTGDPWALDTYLSYVSTNIVNIKYSGIIATNKAITKGINNYPAFKAVKEYPTSPPEGSSIWYLPSYRQLTDIRNLFKHPQRRELITKAGGNFFKEKYPYCSATERSSSNIWRQGFVYTENYEVNSGSTVSKTYGNFVRGVLTF